MKKFVLFVFNGDPMCFIHVLLNALDMAKRGFSVKLVIEGKATALIPEMIKPESGLKHLYEQVIELNLIDCVCNACASKMNVLENVKEQNLPLCAELKGHPSIARYIDGGYEVLTF